jgi:hypothetical protein
MSNKNIILDVTTDPINGHIYNFIVSKGADYFNASCSTPPPGSGSCHNASQDPSQLYLAVLKSDSTVDPLLQNQSTMSMYVLALTDGYKEILNSLKENME